jgi:sulfate/thiosulfate transport system permease protein
VANSADLAIRPPAAIPAVKNGVVGQSRRSKYVLRGIAMGWLTLLLITPLLLILTRTFESGIGSFWQALTMPDAVHALNVTMQVALMAVAVNVVFGVGASLLLVRSTFRGRRVLSLLIDLPVAVSPVVVGLALILVYGKFTWLGGWLGDNGIEIIFNWPGMVLATVFISLPLVVRAVVPVLTETGDDMEQAARTLGANWFQILGRITLPAIRGALTYGVVLCFARALGEYGAVAVVSGKLVGNTQTLPLYVEERFQNFDEPGAFAVATLLAFIATLTLIATHFIRAREGRLS